MALILTGPDVMAALTMRECIASQEDAFRMHSLGSSRVPERILLPIPECDGLYGAMLAYLPLGSSGGEYKGAMGVKVLSYYENNPSRYARPSLAATILLHDPCDGSLLAIIEGAAITALRTAAGSAVATKYLARQDASVVGVLGSGVQAAAHLLAMREVRAVKEARVYSRDQNRRSKFAAQMSSQLDFPVHAVTEVREAVESVDILIIATTAREPIVDASWIAPGTHINCVGSADPDRRELDDLTVLSAKIVVDTREAALKESGVLVIPIVNGVVGVDLVHAELGEVVAGFRTGRADDDEITLFISVGVAIQDVAAAVRTYERALQLGIGQSVGF